MKNIVLIGLPGSGKTSVAQFLRRRTGHPCWDTDWEIVRRTGKSIGELFAEGEGRFRVIEAAVVQSMAKKQNGIIATGGGVVLNPRNMAALKANGIVIFLNRSVKNILQSVDLRDRPLLAGRTERLLQLERERHYLYRRYADYTVSDSYGWVNMQRTVLKLVRGIWQ